MSYEDWIPQWISNLTAADDTIRVPPSATAITTPLITGNWVSFLANHPNKQLIEFFITGISQGFRIGYNSGQSSLKSASRNLPCASHHPEIVDQYLAEECAQHRVAGPYNSTLVPDVHVSRFGVIPKNHQPNKWRFIVDLSHPVGHSINDGIPKSLCSLSYITVDQAIGHIQKMGRGTLLAKIDIKHAFRLLPVHPADRHLLAMQWKNQIFIDTCLPFGLRSALKLFNTLADLLSWILQTQGITPVLHYLDDFLLMDPPQSSICYKNLEVVKDVCAQLGIPLALEKVEGPSESLPFWE